MSPVASPTSLDARWEVDVPGSDLEASRSCIGDENASIADECSHAIEPGFSEGDVDAEQLHDRICTVR